ncbi:uncharacterized protein LOC135816016 [Sycon ciliatum]|uniref:uncharacterized protein LOC135816016 n=1 Tax=Sycon ciliatum TaxID=27933 RepID=UPI0031F6115C
MMMLKSLDRYSGWLLVLLIGSIAGAPSWSYISKPEAEPASSATITSEKLPSLVDACCVIATTPHSPTEYKHLRMQAAAAFEKDHAVCAVHLSEYPESSEASNLLYFTHREKDLSCLHPPPKVTPKAEPVTGVFSAEQLVDFINSHCGTYRTIDGTLNAAGRKREALLGNLYDVPERDETKQEEEQCEQIEVPTTERFYQDFLSRSKPVIIKKAVQNWTAVSKWSNDFFYARFGGRRVHVKLSPDGEFEGCESDSKWEGRAKRRMPAHIRSQMDFPDLVVVRPATADVPFSAFMDHITLRERPNKSLSRIAREGNVSAYLEYTSIPNYMPELEDDILPMPFLPTSMRREHLNLWLSDGNTLGKLHFDPFDNILAQIDGIKEVTLFSPHHNERMYEGYIPEAKLGYSAEHGVFQRSHLLESTALVMSPVDIKKPDLQRFPLFQKARSLKCRLTPGDVLFMPAFWWHEVQSRPSPTAKRNLAVNFWYTPFLTKKFPCASCKLDVNPAMRHLLDEF